MSISAVTWVRFGFGLPFTIVYFLVIQYFASNLPKINDWFLINCLIASIIQIAGTFLLVWLFSHKNFAICTIFAKTEVIQAAIFGFVFFGEYLDFIGVLAILIGVVGILIISLDTQNLNSKLLAKLTNKKFALIGILSGSCFALCALFIKNASLQLGSDSPFVGSSMTLLVMTLMQTLIVGIYLLIKQKEQFCNMRKSFKISTLVGLTSTIGSIGWFAAFALTNVAYVKTVGQIELLFSIIITHKIFKEKFSKQEKIGGILVILSILTLVAKIQF